MRKKMLLLLPLCLMAAAVVWASAAGDAGDPLASLSYLHELRILLELFFTGDCSVELFTPSLWLCTFDTCLAFFNFLAI